MTLLLELPPDLEELLRAGATARGQDVNTHAAAALQKTVEADTLPVAQNAFAESRLAQDARTLDEELAALAASIPPEELAKLPNDMAEQHDHYAYGTPKR